ncbi:unnamed protein product, partial [Polarella glacialis]
MIGEMLYPRIAELQPELAREITDMMLWMDNSDLLILLESDAQLKGKRLGLDLVPESSVENQSDVLTNGLDVATTPPGGTSTLPAAAGSEAAQAASECPALTAE